jgi:hypothetical protein
MCRRSESKQAAFLKKSGEKTFATLKPGVSNAGEPEPGVFWLHWPIQKS